MYRIVARCYIHVLLCCSILWVCHPRPFFATRHIKQSKSYIHEAFHEILADISMCEATQGVREFIVAAYVRGASVGTAEHTALEGNTAVFTKRRYRDAWNRCVTRRVSHSHNHAVKIKAKVRARGNQQSLFVWSLRHMRTTLISNQIDSQPN